MDLMDEQDPIMEQKKKKKTKIILTVILSLIVILIIAAIVVLAVSVKIKNDRLKVFIDGMEMSNLEGDTNNIFIIENGKIYTSIRGISDAIEYNYYNGKYNEYTEDKTSCYVTNFKEIVTFTSGEKSIRKYSTSSDSTSQQFDLDEEITTRATNLYVSEQGLERAFNLQLNYKKETNTISIYTLQYLAEYYEKNIENCSLLKSGLDTTTTFNNEKALLYNLVVVKDPSTNLFGVNTIDGKNVITARYTSVEFIEGINDFIVKTDDNKFGIIGSDGITKVKPEYDKISEIDKDQGLYLVTSGNKQGVINRSGKIIVYQDYDGIGLEGNISDSNVTNRYLLYGNLIPVKLNGLWGLINLNGQNVLPIQYNGIGCRLDTAKTNSVGVVLVPDLNGIVVEQDQKLANNTTIKKYGIVEKTGTGIVNFVADSCYKTTESGVTKYYITVNNQVIDIVDYYNKNKNTVLQDGQQSQEDTEEQTQDQTQSQLSDNQQ